MAKLTRSLKWAQRLITTVLLTVGLGLTSPLTAQTTIAPDWVGENVLDPLFLEETRMGGNPKLGQFGICFENQTSAEAFGTIISQDPAAGAEVPCAIKCIISGPVIDVVISAKPPIPDVTVPDPVSYTHLTLPTICFKCRSRWAPSQ